MPTAGTLLNLTYDPTLQMRAAVKWIPWRGSAQYIPLYCKNYSAEVRGGRLLELNAFPARGENVQSSDGFSGSVLSEAQSDTVCACYFQIWGGTRTRKWREGEKKKTSCPIRDMRSCQKEKWQVCFSLRPSKQQQQGHWECFVISLASTCEFIELIEIENKTLF